MRESFGDFRRRHGFDALPVWWPIFGVVVVVVPWTFALPYLFSAHPSDHFSASSGWGGAFGGLSVGLGRNREFWRLDRPLRRTVLAVCRTGSPSGDRRLDGIAERRLMRDSAQHSANSNTAMRVFIVICVAAWATVPLVAAVRSSLWWLFALAPLGILLVLRLGFAPARIDAPQLRLNRLRESYGGSI